MEGICSALRENGERLKNTWKRGGKSLKPVTKRLTAWGQAASRLLSCLSRFQAASRLIQATSRLISTPLHQFTVRLKFEQSRDHFVIPKHLKSQFNAWIMILNIQTMINSSIMHIFYTIMKHICTQRLISTSLIPHA